MLVQSENKPHCQDYPVNYTHGGFIVKTRASPFPVDKTDGVFASPPSFLRIRTANERKPYEHRPPGIRLHRGGVGGSAPHTLHPQKRKAPFLAASSQAGPKKKESEFDSSRCQKNPNCVFQLLNKVITRGKQPRVKWSKTHQKLAIQPKRTIISSRPQTSYTSPSQRRR